MYRRAVSMLWVLAFVVFSGGLGEHGVEPTFALPSAECTHYVDNQAGSDGDGSWSNPWLTISGHVNDLAPGDVMCVRGDASGPGRAYHEERINLDPSEGTAHGTATNPITVQTFAEERVIIYPDQDDSGTLLQFDGINYWHWEGFILDEMGEKQVKFNEGASHNVLRDCEVRDGSYVGIALKHGDENTVEGCRVHGFTYLPGRDAHAITLLDGRGNVIRNNEMYDFTGDGLQVLHGNSMGTLVEGNHIYTTNGRCSENAIDIKSNGAQEQTIVRSNVLHGYRVTDTSCGGSGSSGAAIAIHGELGNILVERNEIYDSNGALRVIPLDGGNPANVEFVNNFVHDMDDSSGGWISGFGVQATGTSDLRIYHNTFVNLPSDALNIDDVANLWIQNNLFYNIGGADRENLSGEVVIDYNGWFPNAVSGLQGPHDVVAVDPQFVDPGAGDYHLQPTSPAIDRGYNVGMPANDFDGLERPYGEGYDLGAFETHNLLSRVKKFRVAEGQIVGDQITVTLTWASPGYAGDGGLAVAYHLRFDDAVITTETWEGAQSIPVPFGPGSLGAFERLVVPGLSWSGGTVYFAIRTTDADENWSDLSDPAFYPSFDVFLPLASRDD